jgi:hypothetical protein
MKWGIASRTAYPLLSMSLEVRSEDIYLVRSITLVVQRRHADTHELCARERTTPSCDNLYPVS